MARREDFDGNIGEEVVQLDDVDQLRFIEVRPDYVIRVIVVEDDVRRTLPEIHIPRRLIATMPRFYIELVRRSVRELVQYFLRPSTEYNPLLSMLAWNADYWSVTFHASGDSLTAAFYPVYINPRPAESVETPRRESSTDDEEPGPSHQVNNRSGGPHMDESSSDDEEPGPSHQANNSSGGLHMDESSSDDEQPGPSRRANSSEIRSGGSRTPADQSLGSHDEMRQGVKRKREASGSSRSREWKRKRSDHSSDSDSSSD